MIRDCSTYIQQIQLDKFVILFEFNSLHVLGLLSIPGFPFCQHEYFFVIGSMYMNWFSDRYKSISNSDLFCNLWCFVIFPLHVCIVFLCFLQIILVELCNLFFLNNKKKNALLLELWSWLLHHPLLHCCNQFCVFLWCKGDIQLYHHCFPFPI